MALSLNKTAEDTLKEKTLIKTVSNNPAIVVIEPDIWSYITQTKIDSE
jgi:hypothetical protein